MASTNWTKALEPDELPEGRVKTVVIGTHSLCLTHYDGQYGALDNHCPHQGGPLGEGSIEKGLLRCPWHGWDYCPLTGKPPGDQFDDGVPTYAVEVRDDGVYVAIDSTPEHHQTVSDLMIQTMVNWGVRWCFGMVGHSNLHIADAIRRKELTGEMTFIGIRHEGAASFACSAYGKLTGRPASCLAIAGPGATNLLTGLWDANVDRAPVIALTGQVASQVLGRHNFQEIPLEKAFGDVAGYSHTVLTNSDHSELMSLACKSALVNQSVSHLIFPDEIAGLDQPDASAAVPDGRIASRKFSPPESPYQQALAMLQSAKRPVIIVGHGARYEMDRVVELAEQLNAPVLTTFKGKGLIPDSHPLGCGVLGRSGTPIASHFMNESDVLLVLGASFSNHTGITPKKPTIQVDLDPMTLAKFHSVDCLVNGDIGIVADRLKADLQVNAAVDQRDEIAERWKIWNREKASRRYDDRAAGVNSASIFAALSTAVDDDAIIAVDVGNNAYSFGRYFECNRQAILMSGYLGSIGFAFPAAMGAWAATQESGTPYSGRQVVSVSGDGGFGQYLAEFSTAVKYQMNITHVLLHNKELGKISKEQRAGMWEVWQTSLHNPSFAQYATLCGGLGIRVESAAELDAAYQQALAYRGPAIVEIMSDSELI
ncbi:thiamine pyrophosphate-dependent enzyme [Rosistilla oblonga]|uniref:thiamine pyrophosphate-dependent enzyme n=1 Tax=Rosistilla oblonga TaxID=2527990 RepID=UPI003A97E03C